ncbi:MULTISPECIES: helix-turn-helix domain-containing protein [unclassified Rhizobium]|uniref:helix-turn-helix domain-containing protein n=1 Tax=unclassified Rhizobium TaxID=2613769 RepID=UPI0006F9F1CA|nr:MULTISPECIES: helix-turn-helix domain-containing protein [unclassified Rhizobium]KQV39905.1 hypothetical protein ASC86_21905 [Rhizobium sp. Root1212]KRD31615.1 hypothetical protein ASE37_22950 [Rhizobium sp. Root268]
MTINIKSPIAEMRKATGYSVKQLSLVSGLTQLEINRLESGDLVDETLLGRLLAAVGGNIRT